MTSLRDRVLARRVINPHTVCKVSKATAALPEDDRADWLDMLAERTPRGDTFAISARMLSDTLREDYEINVPEAAIQRHRRDDCMCGKR